MGFQPPDPTMGMGGGGGSTGGGSGFNWQSLLGILPMLGGLFGSGNNMSQLQGSESQMASELMNMIGGMNNDFAKYFQPVMGGQSASIMGDLASSAGNLGQSNAVYSQEAATGLSPQVSANAQSQLLQGYDSSLQDMRSQATPGSNLGAMKTAAQNNYLSQATNLSGQLANESQQYKNMGAQGLAGNEFNALQAAQGFTNSGIQMQGNAMSSLDSLYQSLAGQSEAYAQAGQSSSPWSSLGSIFGSIAPMMFGL